MELDLYYVKYLYTSLSLIYTDQTLSSFPQGSMVRGIGLVNSSSAGINFENFFDSSDALNFTDSVLGINHVRSPLDTPNKPPT